MNNNPLKYTDPSGHRVDEEQTGKNRESKRSNSSTCGPNTSTPCYNEKHGLCLPGIGCSGGKEYNDWWTNWYLPRMDDFLIEDISTGAQFLADPLSLGMDSYENWRGIPIPKKYGFGIDALLQYAKDLKRDDLTDIQRFGRAGLNGAEGMLTSGVSTVAGVAAGDAALAVSLAPAVESGQIWLPAVAYWAAYVSTYLAVNYALGEASDFVNAQVFYPLLNLGTP